MRSGGGEVMGVGAVVDRSGGSIDFGVKLQSVISMEVKSYPPDECPLCHTEIPSDKAREQKYNNRIG